MCSNYELSPASPLLQNPRSNTAVRLYQEAFRRDVYTVVSVISIHKRFPHNSVRWLGCTGYLRNHTRGIYSDGTLQKTYFKLCTIFIPCPELVLVMYSTYTRTPNFCKFGTPRATRPGLRVEQMYLCLYRTINRVSYVCRCNNTRNFYEICNTSLPLLGTFHNSTSPTICNTTRGKRIPLSQYLGYRCLTGAYSGSDLLFFRSYASMIVLLYGSSFSPSFRHAKKNETYYIVRLTV